MAKSRSVKRATRKGSAATRPQRSLKDLDAREAAKVKGGTVNPCCKGR